MLTFKVHKKFINEFVFIIVTGPEKTGLIIIFIKNLFFALNDC